MRLSPWVDLTVWWGPCAQVLLQCPTLRVAALRLWQHVCPVQVFCPARVPTVSACEPLLLEA